jgi:calnexin
MLKLLNCLCAYNCGIFSSAFQLHFIFRHKNPLNGTFSEKHCKKPKERLEEPFKDKLPHLYTLHIQPDNTFTVKLDNKIINEGNLLDDFTPPVNPPSEIDDPNDKKPVDWDEREKIPDPEAHKPDDWDEDAPAMIPDPAATKPESWLEDEPEMIPDPNAEKPDDWLVLSKQKYYSELIEMYIFNQCVSICQILYLFFVFFLS